MDNVKVELNGVAQLDITGNTATSGAIKNGYTAFDGNGGVVTGSGAVFSVDEIASLSLTGTVKLTAGTKGYMMQFNEGITGLTGTADVTNWTLCFQGCSGLTGDLYLPNVTTATGQGFAYNYFSHIYAPKLKTGGNNLFWQSPNLEVMALPSCNGTIGQRCFSNCTSLEVVDFGPDMTGFTSYNQFENSLNMTTIILRRSTALVTMSETGMVTGSVFKSGGTGGTIYIPKVFYDHLGDGTSSDYKAATNWSTVDGYGTITWAQIEGSYYETHYADGTEIPTT